MESEYKYNRVVGWSRDLDSAKLRQLFEVNEEDFRDGDPLRVADMVCEKVKDIIAGVEEYVARCLAYIQHSELKMYTDYINDRMKEFGFPAGSFIIDIAYSHFDTDVINVSARVFVDDWMTTPSASYVIDKNKKFVPALSNTNDAWFDNGEK